jgi:hypothetical protein
MPQERLEFLCRQASIEFDPQKLIQLISEINDLIDKKFSRRPNSDVGEDPNIPGRGSVAVGM